MFQGSMVALVTPMHENGDIDEISFCELIEWHIESQTQALIIAGTTGESATLSVEEQIDLIKTAVDCSAHRIPIIAGTGSNSTQHAIELSLLAEKAGADACLIVTPYYNKPTQKGLYAHYKTIASKVNLPIILYNVPGRTGCDLLPETVAQLAQISNIVAIKEATGQAERVEEILKRCPNNFLVYSGEDIANFKLIQHGACGVISVTANAVPRRMQTFCETMLSGNSAQGSHLHEALMPLHKGLFVESNPIPIKWLLYKMGKIPNGIRLPLLTIDEKYHADFDKMLSIIHE